MNSNDLRIIRLTVIVIKSSSKLIHLTLINLINYFFKMIIIMNSNDLRIIRLSVMAIKSSSKLIHST